MTPADIIERAFDVFSEDMASPPPLTLRGGNQIDGYNFAEPFDADRDRETDEYLEGFSYWGLIYLDARSWRHYLPRLIDYAFRKPDDPAMVIEALVRSLRPPDRYPPRLATLTREQEATIRDFLEQLALTDGWPHVRDDAQQALEEWWLPNPHSRPTSHDLHAARAAPTTYREVRRTMYQLAVPDTLVSAGERDIPSESRRVETWGGYLCGDAHAIVAVNVTPIAVRSLEESVRARQALFREPVAAREIEVRGTRRARRLDGLSHGDSPAEPKALTIVFAEASSDLVTLRLHTWPRDDLKVVVDRIVTSFEIRSGDI